MWREHADQVPLIGYSSAGALIVAVTEMDWEAMSAAVELDDAKRRGFTLLPGESLRARGLCGGDVRGALWCRLDSSFDPTRSAPALLTKLAALGVNVHRHVEVTSVEPDGVEMLDSGVRRRERADLVLVCPGSSEHWSTPPDLGPRTRVTRHQMFETAPTAPRLTATIADGDTMRRQPGFVSTASLLGPREPDAARWHARLRAVQRRDGRIVFGEISATDAETTAQRSPLPERHLKDRLEAIVGARLPLVERRWTCTHTESLDGAPYRLEQLAERSWLVSEVDELGLAGMPMLARRLIESAFDGRDTDPSRRPIDPAATPAVR